MSDADGKPTAVVDIREVNGALVGTIRALLAPATAEDSLCGKCTDDRRDRRVVGMEILRNLRRHGDEWTGGEILDPENGKTYRAKVRLDDGGRTLIVRGYIGYSIFGRSQTWIRRDARNRPDSTSQSSVDSIVSTAGRKLAPNSRRAFAASTNQKRVAYGTTCGLYGTGIFNRAASREKARTGPFGAEMIGTRRPRNRMTSSANWRIVRFSPLRM
jgi:hypothetical protein